MTTNVNFNSNNQSSRINQDYTITIPISKTISDLYKKALSYLESAKRWAHEHPTSFKTVAIISAAVGIGLLMTLSFKTFFIASVVLIVAASAMTVAKGVSDFIKQPVFA
jgi:hypothetical protein